MAKIKICGLSRIEDIKYCNKLKPDYIGFILGFPKSKRNITFDKAKELKSHLDSNIKSVGVFVNADIKFITQFCNENIIDLVQLHGNEDINYISDLKSKIDKPIIKAVRVQSLEEILKADTLPCDYLLLDTYVSNIVGGSGLTFDWSIIPKISKPYFLAGGLTSENVSKAIKTCNPYAVDVSSSVEDGDYKSYNKIEEFISQVRKNSYKCTSLEEVRTNIDRIDNEIIKLIAERSTYVLQASKFKKNQNDVKAPNRVEEVIKKVRNKATEYGANANMIEALYREMISRFVNMELDEFNKNN